MLVRSALLVTSLVASLTACAGAQLAGSAAPARGVPVARADTAALRRTLDSLAGAHHGVVAYTVHNLDTGERLERREQAPECMRPTQRVEVCPEPSPLTQPPGRRQRTRDWAWPSHNLAHILA